MMIGFKELMRLALGVSVIKAKIGETTDDPSAPLKTGDLWKHSFAVATAAMEIARLLHFEDPEEAFA